MSPPQQRCHLAAAQGLKAHKRRPGTEKRLQKIKTVHEIAPALLKDEGRIEALFFPYFAALVVLALIEREIRCARKRESAKELPIYPEERQSRRPSSEQILLLFGLAERHFLLQEDQVVHTFDIRS